jgi:hypothetical protein
VSKTVAEVDCGVAEGRAVRAPPCEGETAAMASGGWRLVGGGVRKERPVTRRPPAARTIGDGRRRWSGVEDAEAGNQRQSAWDTEPRRIAERACVGVEVPNLALTAVPAPAERRPKLLRIMRGPLAGYSQALQRYPARSRTACLQVALYIHPLPNPSSPPPAPPRGPPPGPVSSPYLAG